MLYLVGAEVLGGVWEEEGGGNKNFLLFIKGEEKEVVFIVKTFMLKEWR